MPQQEQRPAGLLRPCMQPPRRGQVEPTRIAVNLQHHRGRDRQKRRLLGDPQGVAKPFRLAKEQGFRRDAEQGLKPPGMRKTGLAKDFGRADPQDRCNRVCLPLEDEADQGQHEAGDGTRVAGLCAVNLGQRRPRQATAQGGVEPFDTDRQDRIAAGNAAAPDHSAIRIDGRL